jgi:4-amino-4-deoxy-L-arabinose transferase-like glycosyltransferase
VGVTAVDRTLAFYAGFLLGLLAKPPVVLAVLALLSLWVFAQKRGQALRTECPKAAVT